MDQHGNTECVNHNPCKWLLTTTNMLLLSALKPLAECCERKKTLKSLYQEKLISHMSKMLVCIQNTWYK